MNRSELRDELAGLILGGELELTSAEVVEKGGLSLDDGQRLWRALGFPDTGDSVAYGEADVRAVSIVASAIETGVLDEKTAFRMTRALGHTMSRLADWQVSTLVEQVEHDVEGGKSGSRLEAAVELATTPRRASRSSSSMRGAATSPLPPPASRRWARPTRSCCRPS